MRWMQESEIKHGRIAMLAVVGWLVQVSLDRSVSKLTADCAVFVCLSRKAFTSHHPTACMTSLTLSMPFFT